MKKVALLALLLPLVMALNCPANKFAIVMERTPEGKVQRELTVWTGDGSDASEPKEHVLAAAQSAYGGAGAKVGKKQRFSATFAESLPADLVHEGLPNYGFLGTSACPMGRVFTYVERMPGRNDPAELVATANKLADTVTRAMAAWARAQPSLQQEPEKLERLVSFLETELRNDLLNVLLMGWQAVIRGNALHDVGLDEEDDVREFWYTESLRAASYIVEHGYFLPDEIPLLSEDSGRVIWRGILRKVAREIGCVDGEPLPAALVRLGEPDEFQAAFEQGLKAIGLTMDEFEQQYASALPALFGNDTNGQVVWRCRIKPLRTNGAWDEEKSELAWEATGRQGCETPQLLFAIWPEPDEAFQCEHLGRIMLEGQRLAEYVTWRAGLTDEQLAEWKAFVAELRPGPELIDRLKAFRFSTPTTKPSTMPTEQAADDPTRGAKLILEQ